MHHSDGEIKAAEQPAPQDAELWFKFFPRVWLDAMRGLTAEQAGYYVGVLCLMYRDNRPLRDDDGWIAHELHKDRRQWRRVRRELFDLGKLWIGGDGLIHNSKADQVLAERADKVRKLTPKPRKKRALGNTPRVTLADAPQTPIADTSPGATWVAPPELGQHLEKSSNEINGPFRGDLRLEIREKIQTSFLPETSRATEKDQQPRVVFEHGKITLFGGLKAFWLERFDGDEDALALGLIQAAAFIQPHGPHLLETKVSAQLARQCRDKRNSDMRYAAAMKQREAERREKPETDTERQTRELMAAVMAPILNKGTEALQ